MDYGSIDDDMREWDVPRSALAGWGTVRPARSPFVINLVTTVEKSAHTALIVERIVVILHSAPSDKFSH